MIKTFIVTIDDHDGEVLDIEEHLRETLRDSGLPFLGVHEFCEDMDET